MNMRRLVYVGLACVFGSSLLLGQPAAPANSGEPGMDLAGYWNNVFHQDAGLGTGGGALVDYGGIPVNEAGRLYALRWDASHMTVRQQQCPGYVIPYFYFAPQNYRFWEERAIRTRRSASRSRCIRRRANRHARSGWTAGRTAWAPHTWTGFATGNWTNNMLTVETTHLKRAWQRVNGVPQSDGATVTEYFIRHGDHMVYTSIVNDPVYLDEPWVRSLDFVKTAKDPGAWLYQRRSMIRCFAQRGGTPSWSRISAWRIRPTPRWGTARRTKRG